MRSSRSGAGCPGEATALRAARSFVPMGRFDERFAADGELPISIGTRGQGVLDCQGDLLTYRRTGMARIGPDGRVDRTFKAGHAPRVPVGETAKLAHYDVAAVAPDGSVVLAGTAIDGVDPVRERDDGRAQRDRSGAPGGDVPGRRREAAEPEAAMQRGLRPHARLRARRTGRQRRPARPARHRAHRRARAARPGTAASSSRCRARVRRRASSRCPSSREHSARPRSARGTSSSAPAPSIARATTRTSSRASPASRRPGSSPPPSGAAPALPARASPG